MNAIKKKSAGSKKPQLLAGMSDILPETSPLWEHLAQKLQRIARGFGFNRVETPLLESPSLFELYAGENPSQIIFLDQHGERTALRSAILPSLMRAYSETTFPEGHKFSKWHYFAPVANYDANQKRYHSQWQFGFELFGEFSSLNEVQLINLIWKFLQSSGLKDLVLEINSTGKNECRKDYDQTLGGFLQSRKYELCNDCAAAIDDYPMQVFRCTNLECRTVAQEAPQVVDYLDADCHKHFTGVLEALDEVGIGYSLNPLLVGGPGTSQTVFAFKFHDAKGDHLLGEGSHHDSIYREITGKDAACFGYYFSIDEMQKYITEVQLETISEHKAEVFLAPLGDLASKKALKLFSELWDSNVAVHDHFGSSGVKEQLKAAEGSKAMLALIIGQKEAMDDTVILRDVKSGMQEVFRYDQIIDEVKKRLGK
ncbi:ATP phosphoribosyltransferase regulatory subunit [Patescibacteria group bacterium]|nr:ATP phosphoribosyltransferase regulatory subunit [Patescibacteria group bacterium]